MDHTGNAVALNDVLTEPDTVTSLQQQGPVHPEAELTWSQAPFIHRLDKLPLSLQP